MIVFDENKGHNNLESEPITLNMYYLQTVYYRAGGAEQINSVTTGLPGMHETQ